MDCAHVFCEVDSGGGCNKVYEKVALLGFVRGTQRPEQKVLRAADTRVLLCFSKIKPKTMDRDCGKVMHARLLLLVLIRGRFGSQS